MSEVKRSPCPYCLNARSDPDHKLMDGTDLSYYSVGLEYSGNSSPLDLVLVSGSGSPVALVFLSHDVFLQHFNQLTYFPRYCPECGRFLMDDYPEHISCYGQESK